MKRVSLSIEECSGSDRSGWPVTQGVPFAEGELLEGAPVRLVDGEGEEVLLQKQVLATWDKKRGSVKWLLCDFSVDIKGGSRKEYFLESADDEGGGHECLKTSVPEPQEAEGIDVTEDREIVTISTGKLTVSFNKHGSGIIRSAAAWRNGAWERLSSLEKCSLYIRDDQGNQYTTEDTKARCSIEVEEAGSLRTSVCLRGVHETLDGVEGFPFILRFHFFAGESFFKLFHTFIFDKDSEETMITDMGIRLPFENGPVRCEFGTDGRAFSVEGQHTGHIVQSGFEEYSAAAGDGTGSKGTKFGGWCSAESGEGMLNVVLRDAVKEFPKGFSASEGALLIKLWPKESGRKLDLRNPTIPHGRIPMYFLDNPLIEEDFVAKMNEAPEAVLDFKNMSIGSKYYGVSDFEAMDRLNHLIRKHCKSRLCYFSNLGSSRAWGLSKTHEIWMDFNGECSTEDNGKTAKHGAEFAAKVNEPLLAIPSPAQMCGSNVLRQVSAGSAAGATRFSDQENALEELYGALIEEPRELLKIYGMLDYGDIVNGHNMQNQVFIRHFKKYPEKWEGIDILELVGLFNNEAQDVNGQLWTYFFRTGKRKYFLDCEAKNEHTADVDFVHFSPDTDEVGMSHYHNPRHFYGPISPSHTIVSGFLKHYYLTGNRRMLEVALSTADNLMRTQHPRGIIKSKSGGLPREYTVPIFNLLEAYQATWNEEYLALALNSMEWLKPAINETGNMPIGISQEGEDGAELWGTEVESDEIPAGGMIFYLMYDLYRLTGEEWVKKWIVTLADHWIYAKECEDYVPKHVFEKMQDLENGGRELFYKIENGEWFFRPFRDNNNDYFDPVVGLAYRLTGKEDYLGYLYHRALIFPDRAREVCRYLPGETFEALNLWCDSVPMTLAVLVDVDEETARKAYENWKRVRREECDLPVFEGDRNRLRDDSSFVGEIAEYRIRGHGGTKVCIRK